ncbi:hypothetical protein K0504_15860 [Neiella marina]|uniref:Uncharacterized protein n=1 Tax=Neiella holothuriorum TaxID=2870530 RepID=A0ABS7EJX0_9GAMM|nr:hypothetical protein [Neiella holothuriorum]MBW8192515.1 hypothetical protein [Neiella holothuriorum]
MERRKPNYASAAVKVLFGMVLGWALTHWIIDPSLQKNAQVPQPQVIEQDGKMEESIELLALKLQQIKASKGDWVEGAKPRLLDESIELTDQLYELNRANKK